MRYITDTVQVTLVVSRRTTLVVSTFVWQIANGWQGSHWRVEGYESEEEYNADCCEADDESDARKGKCTGCRWLTHEDLLPCAVNPMAYGQGCLDYETV